MASTTASLTVLQSAEPGLSAFVQGDAMWSERAAAPREADVVVAWPMDLMQAFSARMCAHGVDIDLAQMMCDRRYAVQQLMSAYALMDGHLHTIASQLFFHFEEGQIGLSALH